MLHRTSTTGFMSYIVLHDHQPPSGLRARPHHQLLHLIWHRPYVALTRSTCFILDDGTGIAVGRLPHRHALHHRLRPALERRVSTDCRSEAGPPTGSDY
ncbi:hypothetical protein BDV95DRAFT_561163 [Massariosphaeria phaeospora]|uniref:Uncharacterized protein n=1 Tax=Massariosphaeria phaeospora TaxID=100035 RepID=A0A7C8ID13_9PLEO|nr:hypothetical protein BDV95DRAFT_561163 [Massariosphaeria phaeospora]